MESPKKRPLDVSGIPRFSRLPIPQGVSNTLPHSSSPQPGDRGSVRPAKRDNVPLQKALPGRRKTSREDVEVETVVPDPRDDESDKHAPNPAQPSRRRPRLSLSDRTMDTLAKIPPSSSPRRRKSTLFQNNGPTNLPLRPSSSMARSRPSSSGKETHPPLPDFPPTLRPLSPEKRPLVSITGKSPPKMTHQKSTVVSSISQSLQNPGLRPSNAPVGTPSRLKPPFKSLHSNDHRPGLGAAGKIEALGSTNGSKTLGAKPTKSRPSAQGAFGMPSKNEPDKKTAIGRTGLSQVSAKVPASPIQPSSKLSAQSRRPSKKSAETTPGPETPPQKSSASLREAIAKAKAERQAVIRAQHNHESGASPQGKRLEDADVATSNKGLLKKRIQMARKDGRLNIAAMDLSEFPAEVMNMYDASALGGNDGEWYESVDLVRLVAADNEIANLGDGVFPDDELGSVKESDEYFKGNMFGGLETLDLHGNLLSIIPLGIRRLQYLTSVNLSKNKLDNRSLQIISQVQSLRELRITENALEGMLDDCITELQQLEILDVSKNRISALPYNLGALSTLHTLSLASNRITSLPSTLLASTSLAVLDVSQNRLTANLVSDGITLPSLRMLDVSHNALTSIVDGTASMPNLQTLNAAENRIEALPDLSGSPNLITLTVSGNKITAVPESLVGLQYLKNLDFSRNDVRKIDERFGFMESLATLILANNPLRDRKFLTLGTEDLKSELRGRTLSTQNESGGHQDQSSAESAFRQQDPTTSNGWSVKPGGILDRSSTSAVTLEAYDLESVIDKNEVKILMLQQNRFTQIPTSVALLTSTLMSLNISNNKLADLTYLASEISLPNLKSLDMSHNIVSSFTPLFEHLNAPKLNELNVTRNRLNSLPPLRIAFPSLTSVLAADNCIIDLKVESVQGLKMLDVSGNEIEHLEPRIGLLGDDGLQTLLVGANRFRVPRRDVVEKGTGAILAWLRGRVPEGEGIDTVHARLDG